MPAVVSLTGPTETKAPNATRAIPDNSNSIPPIIVRIAIIVTSVGLCCFLHDAWLYDDDNDNNRNF